MRFLLPALGLSLALVGGCAALALQDSSEPSEPSEPRELAANGTSVFPKSGVVWRGDFETGDLSQWPGRQAEEGGIRVVSDQVRGGRYAARFIVRPGDDPIGSGGERAELLYPTREAEGDESWWAWSSLFPSKSEFNRNSYNIFTQWHHSGSRCSPPAAFNIGRTRGTGGLPATLSLRVRGGRLNERTCESPAERTWQLGTLTRDRWYDFVFHVKWSSKASVGFVELWVNGRKLVPKTRMPTLYEGTRNYLKQGLYRQASRRTAIVIHDSLRWSSPTAAN